jgi:NADH-quinone oxidoreductase subunit H
VISPHPILSILGILIVALSIAGGLPWVERRLLALWQDRYGPNRVGPFGVLQSVADAIKMFTKEDWVPPFADRTVFILAPAVLMVTVLMSFSVVPVAPGIIVTDLNIGLLFFLGMSSLGVYSIVLAGWSSDNKSALMGAMTGAAQMLSYEVFMGLSLMGTVILAGSFDLTKIVEAQRRIWFIVPQFAGFVIFLIAGLAETRRIPFDLPEAESELIAGYHSEYSGMKFGMFLLRSLVASEPAGRWIAEVNWSWMPAFGIRFHLALDGLSVLLLVYLILAAASAAILLFGMALIYTDAGTMDFLRIRDAMAADWDPALATVGTILIFTGVGFKLALVPFHLWAPDVYEGAPAPVSAFIATASKTAVFAVLLRYYIAIGQGRTVFAVLATIAIASMLAGNLLALRQTNVKRILAYSSIAHLGYVLIALLAGGSTGHAAVMFYLVAYSVTTLGAFAVITVVSTVERDGDHIEDYRGLFWQRPFIASVFTAMLLSLAGIPATAGFIGKFYLINAGAAAGRWSLIVILAVASTIGLFITCA